MNVPLWVAELAASFWGKAGNPEPFPRKLLGPIANAVPLTVVFPPRPTIDSTLGWLRENGVPCKLTTPNRSLRACLFARYGQGFAFIDATDSEYEQRFSLAHELAHFLRHYLQPRERIRSSLGPAALEVFDGDRAPTPSERIHSLLSSTRIGYHVHLMDRDSDDGSPVSAVAGAEDDADRLAYELLAPAEQIASLFACRRPSQRIVMESLMQRFGLPRRQADRYADVLCPRARPIDPFLRGIAAAS